MSHLDQPAHYTILLEGSADPSLMDWCGPVTITTEEMPEGTMITRLSGIAVDQAGIVGIIRHLHGLGVVLLGIKREVQEK